MKQARILSNRKFAFLKDWLLSLFWVLLILLCYWVLTMEVPG